MEGPSIYLAVEWLVPFIGQSILAVEGNTHIGKERLYKKTILDIFSWGKHLVFQFDAFALRIHFMLYGSFEATVKEKRVTGDYPKKNTPPRLILDCEVGRVVFYSCSLKYLETSCARDLYDFSVDVMSLAWDPKQAFEEMQQHPEAEIADILLDQNIFSGVGNIIKNEVLFLVKIRPTAVIKDISRSNLRRIIKIVREFSFQFYEWRKQFVLKQHYKIYRQSFCPLCGEKVCRKKTGERNRISFFCCACQKE